MKTLKLLGEVGWDIWGSNVTSQMNTFNGDDITVEFSSPGGDVFEGVEVYNAFSDYKRKFPNAKINFEIKGIFASMGSYIASNPAIDNIKVESNVSYMIHNPWMFAVGDYHEMKKKTDFLEGLSKMVAPSYANKSGKSLDEIRTLMDAETWYFGQEIVDNGFADEIMTVSNAEDKAVALSKSKMMFTNMKEHQKELSEQKQFDENKAAAILKTNMVNPVQPTDNENIPSSEGKSIMEVSRMTEEELKKDNPELYNTLMKKGADNEREVNSARVKALTEMKNDKDYKDLPEIQEVLDNAIMGTDTVDSVLPKINIAVMKIMKDPARMASIESPTDIQGGNSAPTMKAKKSAEV